MTAVKRAAPHAEWVQMYRLGLSASRIAALVRAPGSTVRYHLRIAKLQDSNLTTTHRTAERPTRKPDPRGQQTLEAILALVQTEGRLPSPSGSNPEEKAMDAWLRRRRAESRAGTLSPTYQAALGAIPDWNTHQSFKERADTRWALRLDQLIVYRKAGNNWPLHKKAGTEQERLLGVWLHVQRINHRHGTLTPARHAALDAELPGWEKGRPHSGGHHKRP